MKSPINYTVMPWMDSVVIGYIVPIAIAIILAYSIFAFFFRRHNMTMRRGSFALITNTVWTLMINLCVFCLAFWQWAFLITTILSLLFVSVIRHELKTAYDDELGGRWGLFPAIRTIRGEAFADLSVEEQLAYKETVVPYQFHWYYFVPITVLVPFCTILCLDLLGVADYIFEVYYFPLPAI